MNNFFFTIGFIILQLGSNAQNYNAEIIVQETNININKDKLTKDFYCEIKINKRAGEKYTKVTIPYSKLNKLSNIDAYIKGSDGRIVKRLKKSEIVARSSISNTSFYEDDYVKEFTLKHNIYPYTIVYSFRSEQNEFFYIDYWTPIIDKRIPTLIAKLNVSVPIDYIISYANQLIKDPSIDTLKNTIKYAWQTSNIDILKSEVYSPPIITCLPSVAITPQDFKFELNGSFKNWTSYGNWQYELLQGLNELPDTEKSKIIALIKDVKGYKERIKILYRYLQDATRYINITIETGGLKPYPASYVAQNKYGDCKALTNYFKSILDYIGIKSFYTKVYAGNPIKEINKKFPSQQFNHVILYIPLLDENIWLDCTSDGAFNYLGTFTQNRDAFVIDKNNSHFLRTPAFNPSDVLETRKVKITYKQNHNSHVYVQNTYRGDMYEKLLELEHSFQESDKKRVLQNYFIESGYELLDYTISENHRDSLKILLSYEASSRNIYKLYGNDILVRNIPFSMPQFENPEVRKLPVQIDYPIYKNDTLVYDIPDGYRLNKNSSNQSYSNRFGQYRFEFFEHESSIIVIKSVLINPGFYPIFEYEDFYSFYKQINEIENRTHISLCKIYLPNE